MSSENEGIAQSKKGKAPHPLCRIEWYADATTDGLQSYIVIETGTGGRVTAAHRFNARRMQVYLVVEIESDAIFTDPDNARSGLGYVYDDSGVASEVRVRTRGDDREWKPWRTRDKLTASDSGFPVIPSRKCTFVEQGAFSGRPSECASPLFKE